MRRILLPAHLLLALIFDGLSGPHKPVAGRGRRGGFSGRQLASPLYPRCRCAVPRELTASELPRLVADYRHAASNAIRAGFDGPSPPQHLTTSPPHTLTTSPPHPTTSTTPLTTSISAHPPFTPSYTPSPTRPLLPALVRSRQVWRSTRRTATSSTSSCRMGSTSETTSTVGAWRIGAGAARGECEGGESSSSPRPPPHFPAPSHPTPKPGYCSRWPPPSRR